MTITKEAFVDLQEKYTKMIKLIVEDSKMDPETEPYLSKYSAREILISMKASLQNLLRNQTKDTKEHTKLTAMLATVYLYLATVALDTEETSVGEENLEKCKETISEKYKEPEFILITLQMHNQFGILLSKRDLEKATEYLETAQNLYKQFRESEQQPVDISDIFKVNLENYDYDLANRNMENIFTLTLYYLAQVYGSAKDALKSSLYCHITLQRQLDQKDYDPIDFTLNAATLSQFFMEKNGFKQARHHLAVSSYILDKYEEKLLASERGEVFEANMEVFNHRSADVARCWAKYGLLLLSKSKERLLNHTDDIDSHCSLCSDLAKIDLPPNSTVSKEDLQELFFTGINVEAYELQVTDQFVLTLEDARRVFLNIQSWSNKAQEYYNLENHASDFIEIVQDQSQMYLNLLFFDDDVENQAKLHKRRIDLLENVLDKVNPQYYLQYCRQIDFELAQAYASILDIKADKLREVKGRPKPQALVKINHLVEKTLKHYGSFIDSFKEGAKPGNLVKMPEEVEKPYLQAFFHSAALHSRYITLDKSQQLKNTEASLVNYKFVMQYCDKFESSKELVMMEYGICKEMATLLPIKILKLKQAVP